MNQSKEDELQYNKEPPHPPRLNRTQDNHDVSKNYCISYLVFTVLIVAAVFLAFFGFFVGKYVSFIGFGLLFLLFGLCFGWTYFSNSKALLYLYDHGHAAKAHVTDIFLDIEKDSSGDRFIWKIKWAYEVDGEKIETTDFLSKVPEYLNVGSKVWILYDQKNPTFSKIYEGFNEKGEYTIGGSFTSFNSYDSAASNPRPGITKPPISSFKN